METDRALQIPFHPLIGRWFAEQVGRPTRVQQQAWSAIAAGKHLLITAPTGSGKTLAAFLWALDQLITNRWSAGCTRVLYVSPLRALNYDIQRNLLGPLGQLREMFQKEGVGFPDLRVLTRSGDTAQSDRRRMLRHPPEILITTPESLNLLLSSKGGRSILTCLSTVILDEIHAVFGTKRGVYLITGVDRLVRLSGEFQRVALSATIRPAEAVAEFVGGFEMVDQCGEHCYTPRSVSIVSSDVRKEYKLRVTFPRSRASGEGPDAVWKSLVLELKEIIGRSRSTLVFVNSRRLCEMLTRRVNQGEEEPVAYAHHGSLSLEIRAEVERRLKAGTLRAIIATHSLELGIDIGALDEVVLVQSPFSISSAVQRVGRSGHQVGQASRGTFLPTHAKDLLDAAALAPAILKKDIESAKAVVGPLDVLAQIMVSMVGMEAWNIDDLYANLTASHPYRQLSRKQFDLVLNMLAGRYADSRIRELKPLVSIDRLAHTVTARRGALQTLYLSGGVIPDRGYFDLRHQETNARIGDLDEEFVWEARVGDTFTFGAQNWRIHRITHNDVFVLPGHPKDASAPFWKGEEYDRDFHFSERIGQFLEEADRRLDDPDFQGSLERNHCMEAEAAGSLIEFLKRQREETGCPLPHRRHLLVEFVAAGPGGTPQAVLHTMWGGRINRPLAMALDASWLERFGYRLELFVGNDCLVLQLPHAISGEELLSLVPGSRLESLLRGRLEGSGFFGARFRECAGRALLLPRERFGGRMPLWLSRLRSQKLLEAVLNYDDFPILLETWRTCLQDEFDLENLKRVLAELESGSIAWTEVHTSHPSPFAQSDRWRQVNRYMYMDDTPRSDKMSRLRGTLLRDMVFTEGLRPTVSRSVVERFELKRKRLSPGYSPQNFRELLDWVVERIAIPKKEWNDLLDGMRTDHGLDPLEFLDLHEKLVQLSPRGAAEPLIAAREMLPQIISSFYAGREPIRVESLAGEASEGKDEATPSSTRGREDPASLLGQWLQYYGPVTVEFLSRTLGMEGDLLALALEDLIDSQKIIQGQLMAGGRPDELCDSENFEILLRLARLESIPSFEPLGIDWLPLFLADHQGMTKPADDIDGLYACMEKLLCYPVEAGAWESEVFPARLRSYDPSWLDTVMQEGNLLWVGSEGHRVTFCFESDIDLLFPEPGEIDEPTQGEVSQAGSGMNALFRDPAARYDFAALAKASRLNDRDLSKGLWEAVWQGKITNDTFLALRRAMMTRFKDRETAPDDSRKVRHRSSRVRRRGLAGRREGPLFPGNWRLIPPPELAEDLLEAEERRKDRARLLLDRYGILFRELLQREWPGLRWSSVFRALRIMELSGEVMTGIFFHGISGLQFISHRAFRSLQRKLPDDAVYWMNATDPASLCGIALDSIRGELPARLITTHLVYRGRRVVLVSRRNGKELTFFVPADDPGLDEYTAVLRRLLTRRPQPLKRITVETINDEKAAQSPYLPVLRNSFDVSVDYQDVTLYRKIR